MHNFPEEAARLWNSWKDNIRNEERGRQRREGGNYRELFCSLVGQDGWMGGWVDWLIGMRGPELSARQGRRAGVILTR